LTAPEQPDVGLASDVSDSDSGWPALAWGSYAGVRGFVLL